MSDANRLIEIFHRASLLPEGGAREQCLAEACGADQELKEQIRRLLGAQERAGNFLRGGLFGPAVIITEQPGDTVGRYKLLEQIGEGGCGVVYMAEQQEPVRRQVALKVIKLGMDTKQVVARFEAERQALALMDHPHIAKVFDAGATKTGRPFFVMELVRGVKITDYCEQRQLSHTERLCLFLQVCQAIQHAHQKGVIHRDIKPSNILVAQHDTVAVPKVIDFGIAKATSDQRLTEKTLFTAFEQFMGTPAYMSPEQAQLSGLDIDTRTDIYSLGVLLYELLTGTTPFDAQELLASGIDVMRRTIREKEPLRPSTRLRVATLPSLEGARGTLDSASTPGGEVPPTVAKRRGVASTSATIPSDLDWIVMKCLEKDRSRRYDTANGLAMDLRRHLDNEPIVARPPSAAYRLEKAFRRHKLAFASAAAIAVSLIVGLFLSLWQATEANRARGTAQLERDRATTARALSERLLYGANMNLAQAAWNQSNLPHVRELLEETATVKERGFEWYYWQRQLHELGEKPLREHTGVILSVGYSPDGQFIVTGSADDTAKVWESATGKVLRTLRDHNGPIRSAVFSSDGQRILTASWDKTAKVWDARSGDLVHTFEHEHQVFSAAFSKDGQRVVTGSRDQTVKIWDTATGALIRTLTGHSGPIWSVAFSPDGQRIVSGSWDHTARVWAATDGRELVKFEGHGDPVFSVAFSPDGGRIVSGSFDRTAKVWEAATGGELFTLPGHGASVVAVTFSSDGKRIATAADNQTARVWDASRGELLAIKKHGSPISSVALSPDGQHLVTGGGSVVFSPDGVKSIHPGSGDQTAKVWEIPIHDGTLTLEEHTNRVMAVAFSRDGERIVTGSLDQTAKVWDAATGKLLRTLRGGHTDGIRGVAFSPDGRRIVTGSFDKTGRVWDAASGKELFPLVGHTAWIKGVAFSPDGGRIATCSEDGTAKIYDAVTGNELRWLKGRTFGMWSVAFSPDGRRILTGNQGGDQQATVWDAASGEPLVAIKGHGDWSFVMSAAFSPDGRRIATARGDGEAGVWDAETGASLLPPLKGHSDQVMSVSFSPDGQRILTSSRDHTAKLWDAATGKPLLSLEGHGGWVIAAAFSPDGRRIVTGSGDRTAKVWRIASDDDVAEWRREKQSSEEFRLREKAVADAAAKQYARAQRVNMPGGIKQWLVLLPIPMEGRSGAEALDMEQLPRESQLRPRNGDRVRVGQTDLVWREVPPEDYLLDFNQIAGHETEFSVAYAVCYLHSDAPQSGVTLKIGSDDQAKIFLNEREVYRITNPQTWEPDRDTVSGIELQAGLNVLVFKVVNELRDWDGSIRITDAAGQALKGIRVSLDPEG